MGILHKACPHVLCTLYWGPSTQTDDSTKWQKLYVAGSGFFTPGELTSATWIMHDTAFQQEGHQKKPLEIKHWVHNPRQLDAACASQACCLSRSSFLASRLDIKFFVIASIFKTNYQERVTQKMARLVELPMFTPPLAVLCKVPGPV